MRYAVLLLMASLAGAAPARAATLFDDLGERDGLARIVEEATAAWLADSRISAAFENTDLDRFKRMLFDQLCQISGGNCTYRGHSMAAAHRGLHLTTRDFNVLAEDLEGAMDRLHVPFTVQNRLIALLAPMYTDVVTR